MWLHVILPFVFKDFASHCFRTEIDKTLTNLHDQYLAAVDILNVIYVGAFCEKEIKESLAKYWTCVYKQTKYDVCEPHPLEDFLKKENRKGYKR